MSCRSQTASRWWPTLTGTRRRPARRWSCSGTRAAAAGGGKVVKAEYVMPLLSHSPLEPMNFTAHYHDGKVDLIGPTQWQDNAQGTVAKLLGVKPEDVSVKTTFLGGGF